MVWSGLIIPTTLSLFFLQMVNSGVIPIELFDFEKSKLAHDQLYNANGSSHVILANQSPISYEVFASAAGYEALNLYERHRAKQGGHAPSRFTMEDLLAEFARQAANRLFQSRKLEYLDKKRARALAAANAVKLADEKYSTLSSLP